MSRTAGQVQVMVESVLVGRGTHLNKFFVVFLNKFLCILDLLVSELALNKNPEGNAELEEVGWIVRVKRKFAFLVLHNWFLNGLFNRRVISRCLTLI